jgi:PAS domain S-box-containing protein
LDFDIPARTAGPISVLGKYTGPEGVLSEVDNLIRATPRERLVVRQLRRALLMLRDVGQRVKPDEDAQERVRSVIDRLQVAILALDTEGRYVAVSRGASTLTGYARAELIGKSIFDTGLVLNRRLSSAWEEFVARKQCDRETISLDRSGNVVSIQTEFATILPGLHAAAFGG